MPRNDEQGRERDRETGSGGAAGFFNGGHDRTGNWPGTREDQGRDSRNYERSAYGERRDEHGTFGSRERPREYEQQGGDAGSHRGQPYGQDMERGYRSGEYGGERGGYSSDYGRGGGYGGGIHERDQWGQGREGQYTQTGEQDRGRYGQQPTPRGQNEWGREPGHRSGQQGGYGGTHDWSAERPRTEWSGPQDEPNRHRDWGRDWARESGPFNPGGFGSANRSGPDNAQPRGYGEGGFAGMGSAQGYGREGTFGQWQSGQGPSWPGSGYGRTGDGGVSQQTGGMQGGTSGGGVFGGPQAGGQAKRRGPKNYQRSDERLRELISDRLIEDPHIDSSEVSVEVKDGEVTLTGTVDDRRTKYQIEELVEQIHGVRDVDNRVRVKRGFLANLFGTGDDDGERPRERSSGYESSQAGMTTSGSGSQTAASPTTSTTSPLGSTLSGGATTPGGTSASGGTTSASGVGTEKGAGSTGTERGTAADRDPKRTR